MSRGLASACPQCGAPLTFQGAASLTTVCKYCRAGVARAGVDVTMLGQIPDLVATETRLALGMSGSLDGKGFVVLGRLQLDQGEGAWDEWYVTWADGRFGWLAEAAGSLICTTKNDKPIEVPPFDKLVPGGALTLGKLGAFRLGEVGAGEFVSAEGELPFTVELGAKYRFADATGASGEYATIDYGVDAQDEVLVFVGRQVPWAAAHLQGGAPEVAGSGKAEALACPGCGAPVKPVLEDTKVLTCGSCHGVLDLSGGALKLMAEAAKRPKPGIPLGARGMIQGDALEVIGYLKRAVTVDGQDYTWREYLLHGPKGYRWLSESDGHYLYLNEVPGGRISRVVPSVIATCDKRPFKHFQTSRARYVEIQGEFYWRLETKKQVDMDDYVSPPYLLSCERTGKEQNWSLGEYLSGEDVWKAFKLEGKPPAPRGVAPAQPNPFKTQSWATLGVAAVALLLFFVIALAADQHHARKTVLTLEVPLSPPGSVTLSEPFEMTGPPAAVEIAGRADVSNAWAGLDVALIEEASGEVDAVGLELSYYYGSDGGESWSEGKNQAKAIVSAVKPGRYVLRVEPVSGKEGNGSLPASAYVTVTRGVFLMPPAVITFLGILVYPAILWLRSKHFEVRRWAESDHPMTSSGGDDE